MIQNDRDLHCSIGEKEEARWISIVVSPELKFEFFSTAVYHLLVIVKSLIQIILILNLFKTRCCSFII